jgi:hypothetical protein
MLVCLLLLLLRHDCVRNAEQDSKWRETGRLAMKTNLCSSKQTNRETDKQTNEQAIMLNNRK